MNLTLIEAGRVIGVSPARLRQFIAEGRLKATKMGRDWFIAQEEAERFASVPRPITGRPPARAQA